MPNQSILHSDSYRTPKLAMWILSVLTLFQMDSIAIGKIGHGTTTKTSAAHTIGRRANEKKKNQTDTAEHIEANCISIALFTRAPEMEMNGCKWSWRNYKRF